MLDWRNLPSLSALRAFEAVVRTGTVMDAAKSLNVSHAAISQHVRKLEAEFGLSLLAKDGRSVVPTEAGRLLASALTEGFAHIADGVQTLKDTAATQPVVVAITPSLAERWLMPRLPAFWSAHPNVEIALRPSIRPADLAVEGFDMGIRFGNGDWPGHHVERLLPADFVVAAAPGFQVGDPRRSTWFVTGYRMEDQHWAQEHGLIDEQTPVKTMETYALTLAATRAGAGLSVQYRALVEEDLKDGTLVAVREVTNTDLAYHILIPSGPRRPQLETFLSWLRSAV